MPETFNQSGEVQDIFDEGGDQLVQSAPVILSPVSTSDATPVEVPVADSGYAPSSSIPAWRLLWYRYRTLIIIVVSVGLGLLLLGGSAWWLMNWLSRQPVVTNTATTNTIVNTTIVNVPEVNTNTNGVTTTQFIDSDHDGLSDEEELLSNTNPKKQDTDADGLSDREEVKVYQTDPRNSDTDGDTYTDGNEVTHFYNPNNSDPHARLPGLSNQ